MALFAIKGKKHGMLSKLHYYLLITILQVNQGVHLTLKRENSTAYKLRLESLSVGLCVCVCVNVLGCVCVCVCVSLCVC